MWQRLAKLLFVGVVGLTLITALALTGAAPAAAVDPCAASNSSAVTLTFVNNNGAPVDIYWIDPQCSEVQSVNDLADGASIDQATFASVTWLVRDSNTGAPLLCVIASGTTSYTVAGGSYLNFCDSQDGRLNLDQCDNEFVVYQNRDEDGNPTLDVYGLTTETVSGESTVVGEYLFTLNAAHIEDFEDMLPEENTLLTAENGIRAYYLTSGEWQINGAPDAEGKECVVVFDALRPSRMYHYTSDLPLDAEITPAADATESSTPTVMPTATP